MSFINKDVNKGLLILLLSILFVLAGLEVFYALNFKSINDEYNAKIKELNSTYSNLALYQNVLNKTKSELQLKSEREFGLSTQFITVKSEKDTIQSERNTLKDENGILKTTLDQKNDELTLLNTKYSALNRTYFNQVAQIEKLNVQVSSLQAQLVQCQASK